MKKLTLLSARLVALVRPAAFAAAALALSAGVAHADHAKANALFGQGVHAYYAGNFEDSVESLNAAVDEAGDTDPRPYYFRGLAKYKMGDVDAAKADFEAGAKIEASDLVFPKLVNLSLQKVQGRLRVLVEQYRTAGKAEARDRRAEERAARNANLVELEKDVVTNARKGGAIPRLRYNRDFDDDAGLLVAPASEQEGPAYSEAASESGAPKEEMPADDAPATIKPGAAEEMPEKGAPKPEPEMKLEAEEPAEKPAAEEAPAAAGKPAPGRVGRLLGIFTKPISEAAGSAAKGASGAVPGLGGPPAEVPNPDGF